MTTTRGSAPRVGGATYRPRLTGKERRTTARDLARDYERGATIRGLVAEYRMSYGTVRLLLLEEGVQLRGRGGRVTRD
ncbi:helix-turn-helix domain-containing protein [Streptomyces diacarni]|uniref:helix-turn-helix domain-containing protein n=1 Tax=Streptomyces diacarni TaxID=2800381 RepID=UPI0033DADC20